MLSEVVLGSGLARLDGCPFEVRYSCRSLTRARAVAAVATDAYRYFSQMFGGLEPDLALLVLDRTDWESRQPYGLPFFNDESGQIRPVIVVMPAGRGDFWLAMGEDLCGVSGRAPAKLLATYPDGPGGLDLQPFFDLVVIHELGHAFAALGDLQLPTLWLGEIFANLALHTFVATRRPQSLDTLQALPTVGAKSRRLRQRMRAEGFTTLDELELHYAGGDQPMSPLNYVWYQYRWLRLAARIFDPDGEAGLIRLWEVFHQAPLSRSREVTTATLARLLRGRVSETLGRAVHSWR